ncbi:MAG TPA: MFS transporter [Bacteroidota bacterium]|nr:MFS transporter [Bacteroidota bacterium]
MPFPRFDTVTKRNYWIHVTEGALYLSSSVLLSPQTVFPALVIQLGGTNLAVGAIPIIVYLMYYLPQIVSANYIRGTPFRRAWTLRLGILQRIQVLFLAVIIAIFGLRLPALALGMFFILYVLNQMLGGLGSPVWFDLVVKTTDPGDRGKLMGLRLSIGGFLGILNGFFLTAILTFAAFPYNFAAVFILAFLFQFSSYLVLRNVKETEHSIVAEQVSLATLVARVRSIVKRDAVFRKFLVSVALSTVGLMPMGFFIIAATRQFSLPGSFVGLFTITMMVAQVLSGVSLGILADNKGHRTALLVCASASALATLLALVAGSVALYFAVFFFVGVNLGAEMITRYNYVERLAPVSDRPLYVGIMNAWLAPFYFSATLGGWLVDRWGFEVVFVPGLLATLSGIAVLRVLPDPVAITKQPSR